MTDTDDWTNSLELVASVEASAEKKGGIGSPPGNEAAKEPSEVAQTARTPSDTALALPPWQVSRDPGRPDQWARSAEAAQLRNELLARESQSLGRSARTLLETELYLTTERAVAHWQPDKGDFGRLVRRALQRALSNFHASFPKNALWRERRDEEKRDAAVLDGPRGCTLFLKEVDRRLLGLRYGAPHRWYIEGLDPVDLHQEVAMAILEALNCGVTGFEKFERAGQEATIALIDWVRKRLLRQRHKERRWRASSVERGGSGSPTPEELLIGRDRKQQLSAWPKRLKPLLTQSQRRWLDAFLREAAKRDAPRWAHTAAILGRDKSSASRAVELLKNKLEGLHARELLR